MLRGLKKYTTDITAIVTVSDNGGGSGVLREELNIAPPGDIRNCLVALANTEPIMKELLQYRFQEGGLKGQNFGNLFLAALANITGSFEKAVEVTSNVLAITGKVLPVTEACVDLLATFADGTKIQGETQIVAYGKEHKILLTDIGLTPASPAPSPQVIEAILEADVVLLGPGSLYTSIMPNLLIPEVAKALKETTANTIYIANIMSQPGETTGFSIEQHVREIEKYVGEATIDQVIVNTQTVDDYYIQKYQEDGAHMLTLENDPKMWQRIKRLEAPLVKINHDKQHIRHDEQKLADCIFKSVKEEVCLFQEKSNPN
jgi:uncharacterized cofD-like protein